MAIVLITASALVVATSGSADAQSCLTPDGDGVLSQIGVQDAPVASADQGALEYPADDRWDPVVECTATGIDTSPAFPGYLAEKRLSEILIDLGFPPRRPTDAAEQVVIDWEQCGTHNVVFEYGRFGSEADDVRFDGVVVEGLTAGGENVDAALTSEPVSSAAGGHRLTIAYAGGGSGNGHYIDFLRARVDDCGEFVVAFSGDKLFPAASGSTQTVPADIPAGSYDVTLISGDYDRGSNDGTPHFQPNERWRLLGSTPSGYSDDLPDTTTDISDQATTGLSVVFDTDVTSVTAEHWWVATGDGHMNSVVPEFACLTRN